MSSQGNPPKWWQLYLTLPLLVALFLLDGRLRLSEGGHSAVQIGILLLVFGLVLLWLKANAAALSRLDQGHDYGRITLIRIAPSRLADTKRTQYPMLQLPDAEIKGLLNDTAEMDYIDLESYPVNEDLQKSNKE